MPDEPQNPIPEENSILASPQEPTIDAPLPPSTSESVSMPQEVPEASGEADSAVPVNNPSSDEATAGRDNPVVNQPESHKKPEKLLNKYVIPNNKGDN